MRGGSRRCHERPARRGRKGHGAGGDTCGRDMAVRRHIRRSAGDVRRSFHPYGPDRNIGVHYNGGAVRVVHLSVRHHVLHTFRLGGRDIGARGYGYAYGCHVVARHTHARGYSGQQRYSARRLHQPLPRERYGRERGGCYRGTFASPPRAHDHSHHRDRYDSAGHRQGRGLRDVALYGSDGSLRPVVLDIGDARARTHPLQSYGRLRREEKGA